jgi:hypothetical protein
MMVAVMHNLGRVWIKIANRQFLNWVNIRVVYEQVQVANLQDIYLNQLCKYYGIFVNEGKPVILTLTKDEKGWIKNAIFF